MWVSLVVIDVLLKSDLRGVAVGWLVWVSWLVSDVLFRLALRVVAVGWPLWVSIKPGRWGLKGGAITLLQRFFADFCSLRVGGLQPCDLEVICASKWRNCG